MPFSKSRRTAIVLFSLFLGCTDTPSEPTGGTTLPTPGQSPTTSQPADATPSGEENVTSTPVVDVSKPEESAIHLSVRDGVAVYVFMQSGKEYKLGQVQGDQVTLFATYGGTSVALKNLDEAVSKIAPESTTNEQRALHNAILAQQLPGIWIVEGVTIDAKPTPLRKDDADYLIIRADHTYRIVKRGRKPAGTWELNSEGLLEMNASNDEPKTAKLKRQPGDKLELTIVDHGNEIMLRYGRTDLTEEPKASDEE